MRRSPKSILLVILVAILVFPLNARPPLQAGMPSSVQKTEPQAQDPQPKLETQKSQQRDDEFTIKAKVDEVLVYATVLDSKNIPVAGLPRDAFTVLEDGVPQKLTAFRNEDIPISIALVIDNSGSMGHKRNGVMEAALTFVKTSNPRDEIFVVNFNDQLVMDQDFTSKISLLKEALSNVSATGGTAAYDAVYASTRHLVEGAVNDKKVILLITDGVDNASSNSLEETIAYVQSKSGPTIYGIGLFADETKRDKKVGTRALNRMTQETGGLAFYPKKLEEVEPICRDVAKEIRAQYAIGFKSSRAQSEGGFRTLRIMVKSPKSFPQNLQVRTRSGYYAGQRLGAAPAQTNMPELPKKP